MGATLLFDGDCSICSSTARLARRILPAGVAVVPWQRADLASLGLSRREAAETVWWIAPGGERRTGHRAIAAALEASGRGWAGLGRALRAPFVDPLAARAYAWVARHRDRLPGGTPECRSDEGAPAPRNRANRTRRMA